MYNDVLVSNIPMFCLKLPTTRFEPRIFSIKERTFFLMAFNLLTILVSFNDEWYVIICLNRT